MQNYGEALKYQREVARLTQPELAQKIGISQQNISRWERNEVIPNIDFCVKLANFYGISIDELLCINSNFSARTVAPMGDGMTADERELLRLYRELSPYLKGMTMEAVKSWAKKSGDDEQKKA